MNNPYHLDDLVASLKRIGLGPGRVVMVHSSFRSLELPRERMIDVIGALIDVLGPAGTLVMPAHTGSSTDDVFDKDQTPSIVGAMTEVFRTQYPSIRSDHPTHSCCALGRDAQDVVKDHARGFATGAGSPCEYLYRNNGQVLFIGVDLSVATIIHLAEFYTDMPYLITRNRRVIRNGKERTVTLLRQPGHSDGFVKLEPELKRRALIRYGRLASSDCALVEARGTVDTAIEILQQDGASLLCDDPACESCLASRRTLERSCNHA